MVIGRPPWPFFVLLGHHDCRTIGRKSNGQFDEAGSAMMARRSGWTTAAEMPIMPCNSDGDSLQDYSTGG
jgi:hypothetical protein